MHHGFDPAELTDWVHAAGSADTNIAVVYQITKMQSDGVVHQYPVLLVTAR